VMGLAPYGVPRFKDVILEKLVDLKEDGSFRLDMRYFNYCTGLTMTNDAFADLFGGSEPAAATPAAGKPAAVGDQRKPVVPRKFSSFVVQIDYLSIPEEKPAAAAEGEPKK
jgi:hypothetical protein